MEGRTTLVLTRKENGRIIIDDRIIITVVEIRGDRVRLGIAADKQVPIFREEIWRQLNPGKEPS